MSKTRDTRTGKRATLKQELRDLVEGAGCWTLSLALTLSLIPPAAVAYAVEEGAQPEAAAEQPAEEPQAEPEGSSSEGESGSEEAPEGGSETSGEEGGESESSAENKQNTGGGDSGSGASSADDQKSSGNDSGGGGESKSSPSKGKSASEGKSANESKGGSTSSESNDKGGSESEGSKEGEEPKKNESSTGTKTVTSPTPGEVEDMKNAIVIEGSLVPADKSLSVVSDTVYSKDAVEATLSLSVGDKPSGVSEVKFDASSVDVEGGQNLSIYGGADNKWTIKTPSEKGTYGLSELKSVKGSMTYTETTTEVNEATGQTVGSPSTKQQTVEFEKPVSLKAGSVLRAGVDTTPPEITVSVSSPKPDVKTDGTDAVTHYLDLSEGGTASISVSATDSESPLDPDQSEVTLEWVANGASLGKETKPLPTDGTPVEFGGLDADSFIDASGNIKTAIVTYKATNEAALSSSEWDNGGTMVKSVSLTSRDAWLNGAKVVAKPADGVKSASRTEGGAEVTVYNGDVELTVVDGQGNPLNAAVTVKADGTDISSGSYSVTASADTNEKHDVSIELEAPDGYKRAWTETIYTDTTKPAVDTVDLAGFSSPASPGPTDTLFYGKDDTVELHVKVDATTSSTLNAEDPFVFEIVGANGAVTLKDEGKDPKTDELTYTIDLDQPAATSDIKVKVKANSIFGDASDEVESQTFRVDKSLPVVSLDFSGDLTIIGSRAGYKVGVLTVTVEDDNLDSVEITGKGGSLIPPASGLNTDKFVQQLLYVSDPSSPTAIVIGEGVDHEIHVTAKDDAGNTETYDYNPRDSKSTHDGEKFSDKVTEGKFDIDNSMVELVGFEVNGTKAKTIDGIDVYDTGSLEVSVTLKDAHFNIENSFFTVSSSTGDKWVLTKDDWKSSGDEYKASFTIKEPVEQQREGTRVVYSLSAKATDLLENATREWNFDRQIALDKQAPEVTIVMSDKPAGNHDSKDYYKAKSVTATVTVKDPFFDDSNSVVKYQNGKEKKTVRLEDKGSGIYAIDIPFDESVIDDSTKEVIADWLEANAVDLLGHQADMMSYKDSDAATNRSTNKFIIDGTDPEVTSVEFAPKAVGAYGRTDYYTEKTTATITVLDLNFDPDSSKVEPSTDSAGTWDGSWAPTGNAGEFTTTVEYEQTPVEKTADFKITATDYATRTAAGDQTVYKGWSENSANDFVVDTDKPEIKVEFDKNPVGAIDNVDYYDAKPTATITVKDRTFEHDSSKTPKKILRPLGAEKVDEWTVGEDGETWTAKVYFGENRETVETKISWLDVDTYDKAFLAAKTKGEELNSHKDSFVYNNLKTKASSKSSRFVADCTPVQVTATVDAPIKATFDGKDFYNQVVKVTLTVVDNNFDRDNSIPKTTRGPQFGGWSTKDEKTYTTTFTFTEDSPNINSPYNVSLDAFDKVYTASGKTKGYHKTWYDYRTTESDTVRTRVSGASGSAKDFIIDRKAPEMDHVDNGNYPSATSPNGIQFFNAMTSLKYYFSDANGLQDVELSDADGQYNIARGANGFSAGAMKGGPVQMSLVERVSHAADAYDGYARVVGGPVVLRVRDITGNYTEWAIDRNGNIVGKSSGTHVTIDGRGIRPSALVQDTVAPVVSLSPTSLEGTYSNQTQTVTCTVDEFNFHYLQQFDGSRPIVYITKYEGNAGRAMSSWTLNAGQFSGGGSSWSTSYPFSEDGHYIVEAYFKDYAENMSNRVRIGEFTIDKTPPRIDSIVFDNNNSVYNNGYYNAARTATITVTEHNWDSSLEGSFITTNGQILGWSHSGDTHIATVLFGTDGDYNLSVRVTDRAGNVSTTETVPEFTVDLTAPEMIIYNAAGEGEDDTLVKHAYNDAIKPAVRFTDKVTGKQTFDPNNTSLWNIELSPANSHEGNEYPTTSSSGGNDLTVVYEDFTRAVEYDDVYTIRAAMTDLAGNPAKVLVPEQDVSGDIANGGAAEATFSVNRFGSNFIVINPERYEDKDGFLSPGDFTGEGSQPVQVAEINVSGYGEQGTSGNGKSYWDAVEENHDVSVTHGLDTKDLDLQRADEGDANKDGYWVDNKSDVKDEKTNESKVPNAWQAYTYNVYGANFDKDGDYLVAISSDDVATNANVSGEYYNHEEKKIDNAQVSFTFDRTAPRIENVNIENGGLYDHGKCRTVSFTASDNYKMDLAKVLIDGEEAEVTLGDDGLYYATIEAKSFTPRTVVITAIDKAGNEETFTVEGARVTSNVFELHWPAILAVGAAGIGGGIFAKRRRDQKNGEAAA